MGLESYFKNMDPVDFMKQYPLRVEIVTKAQVLGKNLMEAKGGVQERKEKARIVYGLITPADSAYKNPLLYGPLQGYKYIAEARFNSKFGFKQLHLCKIYAEKSGGQRSFPIFYMDWEMNKTYKTVLESAKDSANFFLTAEISGCSIFIEGDEDKPVIYHSNANKEQLQGVNLKKMKEDEITEAKFDLKAGKMLEEVKQAKPRTVHFGKPPVSGKFIKGTDYLDNVGQEKKLVEKDFDVQAKQAHGVDPKFARKKKYQRLGTEGTVFGVRDTKTFKWKFYVQKRVFGIIEFKYPGMVRGVLAGIKGEPWVKAQEELYFYEYPTTVAEIWPGGSLAHAYIHV
ncbi:MAG: hypothetical protein HY885_05315 [Deltaproteobacteria bacterium]|nr:hypothetical protein [Deltaproteobacteria bacterium]